MKHKRDHARSKLKAEITIGYIFFLIFSKSLRIQYLARWFINFSNHLSYCFAANKAIALQEPSFHSNFHLPRVLSLPREFSRLTRNYPSQPCRSFSASLVSGSIESDNYNTAAGIAVRRTNADDDGDEERWPEWEFQSRVRWRISDARGASNFPRRRIQFPGSYSYWIPFTWRYEDLQGHFAAAINEAAGEHLLRARSRRLDYLVMYAHWITRYFITTSWQWQLPSGQVFE